jgi:hypothetical protein
VSTPGTDTAPPVAEVPCTRCGTLVRQDAAKCPSCRLRHPTRMLARAGLWGVGLVLMVVWIVTLLVVGSAR